MPFLVKVRKWPFDWNIGVIGFRHRVVTREKIAHLTYSILINNPFSISLV
jgi:hypothetical protein